MATVVTVGTGKSYTTISAALIALAAHSDALELDCYGPDSVGDIDLTAVPPSAASLLVKSMQPHNGKYYATPGDGGGGCGAFFEGIYNSDTIPNVPVTVSMMRQNGLTIFQSNYTAEVLTLTFDRLFTVDPNDIGISYDFPDYSSCTIVYKNCAIFALASDQGETIYLSAYTHGAISAAFLGCTIFSPTQASIAIRADNLATVFTGLTLTLSDCVVASPTGFYVSAIYNALDRSSIILNSSLVYDGAPPANLITSFPAGDPSLPNNSPAIGTAANIGLTYDIIGTARPGPYGYDIGAWEGPGGIGPVGGLSHQLLLMWEG